MLRSDADGNSNPFSVFLTSGEQVPRDEGRPQPSSVSYVELLVILNVSLTQSWTRLSLFWFSESCFWRLSDLPFNFRHSFSSSSRRSGTSLQIFLSHSFLAHFSHCLFLVPRSIIYPCNPQILGLSSSGNYIPKETSNLLIGVWPHLLVPTSQ